MDVISHIAISKSIWGNLNNLSWTHQQAFFTMSSHEYSSLCRMDLNALVDDLVSLTPTSLGNPAQFFAL